MGKKGAHNRVLTRNSLENITIRMYLVLSPKARHRTSSNKIPTCAFYLLERS